MRTPFNKIDIQRQEGEPESVGPIELETYERCSYCHSKLIFSHDLNLNFLQVVETSRCPGCGVSATPKKFSLN